MTSIHPENEASKRLRPITDPLHRAKLALNDARSRIRPARGHPDFCVGLAKAGTHTLADLVGQTRRSKHEPEPAELLQLMPRARAGRFSAEEARELFLSRRRRLRLDFESSHLLGTFVPYLVEIFPESRFVLLVRELRSWINSMINDQLYVRSTPGYPMWAVVYEEYLRRGGGEFAPEERVLRELDLYPLDHYVAFWSEEITTIIDSVPPARLLVIETQHLTRDVARIAEFLDTPHESLVVPHSYRSTRSRDVLAEIDPGHVARVLRDGDEVAERVSRIASPSQIPGRSQL